MEDLWKEWLALHKHFIAEGFDVAPPFFSFAPEGYDHAEHRILLIGKATMGWEWFQPEGGSNGWKQLPLKSRYKLRVIFAEMQ